MEPRRNEADAQSLGARLYLIAADREAGQLVRALALAVETPGLAAVLLPAGSADRGAYEARIAAAASVIQGRGVALLLEGHAELVGETGADGSHFSGQGALAPALKALKPGFIVGAGGLPTRHDAMLAAESGADYVMFGEPDRSGQSPALSAVTERVAWWNELFEPPCVGFAGDLQAAEALRDAGADFVAVGSFVWDDPRGPAAALGEVWARVQRVESSS